jgi:cytochrome P450 family 142 subfamily A polypeptide 1
MASESILDFDFDPMDTSRGIPHEVYRRLRAERPISKTSSGAWFIARQDDLIAAAREVGTFRASMREPGVRVPPEEMLISEIPEPRHGQIRKIVNSAVAAHRLNRVEDFTRELTNELFDQAIVRGQSELVKEVVMPIPTSVIAVLLGAPREDFHLWGKWSDEVVQGDYPRLNRNERGEGLGGAHPEFASYVDAMIAARKADPDPPDDFATRLIRTEIDGMRLSDLELRTVLVFLLISGNETTRHLISNLFYRLAAQEGLLATLRERPELIPVAVEESLRLDSVVINLVRECVHDTVFRGHAMRAGDRVLFGVASANRDESLYEDPDEFRLDRPKPKGHAAFGGGPHVCPGASLARLEGRIAVEVAVERLEKIELDADFVWEKVPVFWANGPYRLPVTLTPRS